MRKKLTTILLCVGLSAGAQNHHNDSLDLGTLDYGDFFNALEHFIDSLTAPRSYGMMTAGWASGYFHYYNTDNTTGDAVKRALVLPSLAYYHKSGFGVSISAASLLSGMEPFQLAFSGSYDYLQNRKMAAGIGFTRYLTRKDLPFYTSPLASEVNAYGTYRAGWFKPSLAASYGWGSRRSMEKKKIIPQPRHGQEGYTTTETVESISDLTITAAVRHDFYWLKLLGKKDFLRVSPQVALISGTQKFGLNQTQNAYLSRKKGGRDILFFTSTAEDGAASSFQPLSLSAQLRAEWSKGMFFIQPQFFADYLFDASAKKLIYAAGLNTGIIF